MVFFLNDPSASQTGDLFLVAVTGSLGCGKSRVSRWLAEQGAHWLDADQDARSVLTPGSEGWQAVLDHFGPEFLAGDGPLSERPFDRRRLGEIIFRDATARAALEAIIHPRIYQRQALALAHWQRATPVGTTALVVAEIPLLFETDSANRFDRTVAVLCGAAQEARLQGRAGLSPSLRQAVIAQQLPEETKQRLAHYTLDNRGPWEATESLLRDLWPLIQQQARLGVSGVGGEARRAWPHRWPESRTLA